MKKTSLLILLLVLCISAAHAIEIENVKPVKNVILLIPDGTSFGAVSLARWKQWYENPDKPNLNIDPYICGTVRTHSSNAPIGDSAPTTSCYMTGYPSLTGFVSTYPTHDEKNDIYPTDPNRAYQPLVTVLEAAKMVHGKSTGLVFTCEFPHATPADCSAHSYNRGKYNWIAPQMVHNDIDVVIGGGVSLLSDENKDYLTEKGYGVFTDDIQNMRSYSGNKMWALFCDREMPYDIDRDLEKIPSLEEMTTKAIEKLSQNDKGFFLMVEGSKVDWAAHANDPVGITTDFLAFDKACGVALEFARKNRETAVVILPDHGNSGISIGTSRCGGYDRLTKDQLFHALSQFKLTAEGFAQMLNSRPATEVQDIFRKYAGFELNEDELKALYHCKGYKNSPIPKNERSDKGIEKSLYSSSLNTFLSKLITSKTCIGFTTGGHTGEEVFLAAYHPEDTRPFGMQTNIDINKYLCALFSLNGQLDQLTDSHFAKHTDVFADYDCEIIPAENDKDTPTLVVKNKRNKLEIKPFTNIVKNGKDGEIRLNSVIVYVDKNNTFYLPKSLADFLK